MRAFALAFSLLLFGSACAQDAPPDSTASGSEENAGALEVPVVPNPMARFQQSFNVQVGDTVLAFSIADFDRPGVKHSDQSLRGKTVLIDFWATWCAPCVAELPGLRALHERYSDRGFTILSVSEDQERGTVEAFRRTRAMPWLHAHDPSRPDGTLADLFGIDGLPTPFLVGPDGVVIATDYGARGYSLEAALAEHFGEPLPDAEDGE